jgi:phosphatidate phosphatase PAH1
MANFAKIGLNGKVIEVQSVVNEVLHDANGIEQEAIGIDFLTKLTGWAIWKQTSYNSNFRKNYAGIGYTYDEDRDAFIPKKTFNSWILNEDTCRWKAPVAMPIDENKYTWNESTLTWDIVEV